MRLNMTFKLISLTAIACVQLASWREARACSGSEVTLEYLYGDTIEIFGTPEGFFLPLVVDAVPATYDHLINFEVVVTISPVNDLNTVITGSLSVPEHAPISGTFFWRPAEGVLPVGSYEVRLNTTSHGSYSRHSLLQLEIAEAEPLSSRAVSLQRMKLEEENTGFHEDCCQNQNIEEVNACNDYYWDYCEGHESCEYICFRSRRKYERKLSAQVDWDLSKSLRNAAHIRWVTTIDSVDISPASGLETLITFSETAPLPDEICGHLSITHMLTGEELESPETCISASDYRLIPRAPMTQEDYSDSELNSWLNCDVLTDGQREILTSAGKLGGGSADTPTGGGSADTPTGSERTVTASGCQQAGGRLGWVILSLTCLGLLTRRRAGHV